MICYILIFCYTQKQFHINTLQNVKVISTSDTVIHPISDHESDNSTSDLNETVLIPTVHPKVKHVQSLPSYFDATDNVLDALDKLHVHQEANKNTILEAIRDVRNQQLSVTQDCNQSPGCQ